MSSAPGSLSLRCRGSLPTLGKSPGQLGGGGGLGIYPVCPHREEAAGEQAAGGCVGRPGLSCLRFQPCWRCHQGPEPLSAGWQGTWGWSCACRCPMGSVQDGAGARPRGARGLFGAVQALSPLCATSWCCPSCQDRVPWCCGGSQGMRGARRGQRRPRIAGQPWPRRAL